MAETTINPAVKSEKARARSAVLETILLIVVPTLVIGMAFVALGVFKRNAAECKSLCQAQGIYAGLKFFAGDHDGRFPSMAEEDYGDGSARREPVQDANIAYANLCPNYMSDEKPFQVPESAWCWNEKGEVVRITNDFTSRDKVLTKGMNHFAYVATSDVSYPIIADGFASESGPVSDPRYVSDPKKNGGVWAGKKAAVVRCNGAGNLEEIGRKDGVVWCNVGGRQVNMFVPVTSSKVKWLEGCRVLNPK